MVFIEFRERRMWLTWYPACQCNNKVCFPIPGRLARCWCCPALHWKNNNCCSRHKYIVPQDDMLVRHHQGPLDWSNHSWSFVRRIQEYCPSKFNILNSFNSNTDCFNQNKIKFEILCSRMPRDMFGWNWLKGSQGIFLEKKVISVLSICCYYFPLNKVIALHLNKLESSSWQWRHSSK